MAAARCPNHNHSKMNALVRFCATCGEVVNKNIPKPKCNYDEHVKSRKNGNHYCVNCATDLKALS